MLDLHEKVLETITAHALISRGERLVVAVSGGVDSMVLLYVLHALARQHRWQLRVAHLNHQLRGRAANVDEQFVCKVCKGLKVPIFTERAEVKTHARDRKLSLEMAGRVLRHQFLARIARRCGVAKIALAHHADDQVELFFLRLLRGAGPEGLSGMQWSSPSAEDKRLTLIRPLLGIPKAELMAFAKARKIRFREDASNRCTDFLRNRVRHELLPLLKRHYQPAVEQVILRLMNILGAESGVLAEVTSNRERARVPFAQLPCALQRCILRRQLTKLDLAGDFDLVERLRLNPGQLMSISDGLRLVMEVDGTLRRVETMVRESPSRETVTIAVGVKKEHAVYDDVSLEWQVLPRRKGFTNPTTRSGREMFDADAVGDHIILRHWAPGDRFRPIGMKGSVKLQDWFTNQKVSRSSRHRLVVATTQKGEIFWVEGQRIGENFKIQANTKRLLSWTWRR